MTGVLVVLAIAVLAGFAAYGAARWLGRKGNL